MTKLLIAPDPSAPRLTRAVTGVDQTGAAAEIRVVEERALTIYLNGAGDRDRHDHRRLSGVSGNRLPAEPGHAAGRRPGDGGGL